MLGRCSPPTLYEIYTTIKGKRGARQRNECESPLPVRMSTAYLDSYFTQEKSSASIAWQKSNNTSYKQKQKMKSSRTFGSDVQ